MGNVGTESDNITINGCDLLWKEKHPSSLNFPRFTVKKKQKTFFFFKQSGEFIHSQTNQM